METFLWAYEGFKQKQQLFRAEHDHIKPSDISEIARGSEKHVAASRTREVLPEMRDETHQFHVAVTPVATSTSSAVFPTTHLAAGTEQQFSI